MLVVTKAIKELHASTYSNASLKAEDYRQKLVQIQANSDIIHNAELQAKEMEYYNQLRH